jgi:hypothetical protein
MSFEMNYGGIVTMTKMTTKFWRDADSWLESGVMLDALRSLPAMVIAKSGTVITDLTTSCAAVFGYLPTELAGKNFRSLIDSRSQRLTIDPHEWSTGVEYRLIGCRKKNGQHARLSFWAIECDPGHFLLLVLNAQSIIYGPE